MMLISSLFLASLPAVAYAACFDVDVGNGGLVFKPDTLTAAVGDTVNFHFYPGDHGVASGSFSSACTPSGDMWSGFIDSSGGDASMMYTITVSSSDPMFFYCPQIGHCQSGMVMAINPSSSMSLAAYQKAALATKTSKTPSAIGGGMIQANADCPKGGSSSSMAASSMAESSAAASSKTMASSAAASSAASSAAAMSTPAAASSAATSAMVSSATPVPTPVASSAAASSPAAVSQLSDGQPQATSPAPPVYSGAANSMKGAAAAVAAAAGLVGMAMI